ncbi:MAG: hypothetical protein WCA35_08990 [Kovacikia sp.]
MRMGYRSAIAGLAISMFSIGTSAAIAQEAIIIRRPAPVNPEGVLKKFDDAYFDSAHDYFRTRTLPEQVDYVLGLTGFSEQKVTWDGKKVFEAYRETLERQVTNAPVIRTADLPNPFCQSLLTSGCSTGCGGQVCAPQTPPPAVAPVYIPPAVETPAPIPMEPQKPEPKVPALW